MKGLLIHVAADSNNPGFVGPIFPEGTFEHIPIKFQDENRTTYENINAENTKYGANLSDFLPSGLAKEQVHLDPDFKKISDRYRYGEPANSAKGQALRKLERGSPIFFVASLAPYDAEVYQAKDFRLKNHQRGNKNKYVIGFFTIQERKNDGSIEIFGDEEYSTRLTYAVPLTVHPEGRFFKLNSLGKEIWNRETDSLRGARKINERQIKLLVAEIKKRNSHLSDKLNIF